VALPSHPIELAVEPRRPIMTAVDNITSLRQRREAIVNQYANAKNA